MIETVEELTDLIHEVLKETGATPVKKREFIRAIRKDSPDNVSDYNRAAAIALASLITARWQLTPVPE